MAKRNIMKILLTNDDGYKAKGIIELAKGLHGLGHDVTVVAPETEKSGAGHSITFVNDFTYYSHDIIDGIKVYSLNGTPIDCVRFGLFVIYPDAEVVLSGINNVLNVGTDYLYSGTTNAAIEGTICNRKSIAFSFKERNGDYGYAVSFILKNLEKLLSYATKDVTLNVNVPSDGAIKGICVCPIGVREYHDKYLPIIKGGEGEIYHLYGESVSKESSSDFDDVSMSDKGYITITPIKTYQTADDVLGLLDKEKFDL